MELETSHSGANSSYKSESEDSNKIEKQSIDQELTVKNQDNDLNKPLNSELNRQIEVELVKLYMDLKADLGDENTPELAEFFDCQSREEMVNRFVDIRQKKDNFEALKSPRISLVTDWEDKATKFITDSLVNYYGSSFTKLPIEPGNPFRGRRFLDAISDLTHLSMGKRGKYPSVYESYERVKRTKRYRDITTNFAQRLIELSVSEAEPIPEWVKMRPLNRFGIIEAVTPAVVPKLELIKNGKVERREYLLQAPESYQMSAYSVWFALSREVLISDDLNQFTEDVWCMGQRARELELYLIWSQLINNPLMKDGFPLFSSEHNNIGNGQGINIESLSLARMALAQQKLSDGRPWKRDFKYLLIGPALELDAEKMVFKNYPNGPDQANPFSGKIKVNFMPDSKKNWDLWFAIGSRGRVGSIMELGYLEGQKLPYFMMDEDISVDGLAFRYGVDRGARVVDWRSFWCNRLPSETIFDPSTDD